VKQRLVIVDFGVARLLNNEDRALFKRHHAKAVTKTTPGQKGINTWTEVTYVQCGKVITVRIYAVDSNTDEEACDIAIIKDRANKYIGFGGT